MSGFRHGSYGRDPEATLAIPMSLRAARNPCHHPSMKKVSPFGLHMTMSQKRILLKERYHLMVGPLVLLLGVSLASSEPSSGLLGWVAGIVLAVATINRIVP